MSSPEPSFLATEGDCTDDTAATFINDLSIGSLFAKAVFILVFVFVLIRLCYNVFRRFRVTTLPHHGYLDNNFVPNSTVVDPNDRRHRHGGEDNVQNDAVVTTSRVVDVEVVISSYPSFMYNGKIAGDDRNNTTCPICICEYAESEMMRMMPQCGHYFHLKCLDEWLRINWSCPLCRDTPSLSCRRN